MNIFAYYDFNTKFQIWDNHPRNLVHHFQWHVCYTNGAIFQEPLASC